MADGGRAAAAAAAAAAAVAARREEPAVAEAGPVTLPLFGDGENSNGLCLAELPEGAPHSLAAADGTAGCRRGVPIGRRGGVAGVLGAPDTEVISVSPGPTDEAIEPRRDCGEGGMGGAPLAVPGDTAEAYPAVAERAEAGRDARRDLWGDSCSGSAGRSVLACAAARDAAWRCFWRSNACASLTACAAAGPPLIAGWCDRNQQHRCTNATTLAPAASLRVTFRSRAHRSHDLACAPGGTTHDSPDDLASSTHRQSRAPCCRAAPMMRL